MALKLALNCSPASEALGAAGVTRDLSKQLRLFGLLLHGSSVPAQVLLRVTYPVFTFGNLLLDELYQCYFVRSSSRSRDRRRRRFDGAEQVVLDRHFWKHTFFFPNPTLKQYLYLFFHFGSFSGGEILGAEHVAADRSRLQFP